MMALPSLWGRSAKSRAKERFANVHYRKAFLLLKRNSNLFWTRVTHGDIVRNRYGAAGARGEAASGFPHVIQFALPTLRDRRARKFLEEVCRLDALLSVMAEL